ncbi:hypothetical protein [Ktedonobacter robiniae]|nr:hypothetical protein [Ktedonobacter robiniae]
MKKKTFSSLDMSNYQAVFCALAAYNGSKSASFLTTAKAMCKSFRAAAQRATFMGLPAGKYSTKWTDLARKRGTLPSILDTGTNFSRKAAPHLASFIDVL